MRARKAMTIIALTAGALALVLVVGWLGFQVEPSPFPEYPLAQPASIKTVALPADQPGADELLVEEEDLEVTQSTDMDSDPMEGGGVRG